MRTVRDKVSYLPSNVEYLVRNNGLDGGVDEMLKVLLSTDWGCSTLVMCQQSQ